MFVAGIPNEEPTFAPSVISMTKLAMNIAAGRRLGCKGAIEDEEVELYRREPHSHRRSAQDL